MWISSRCDFQGTEWSNRLSWGARRQRCYTAVKPSANVVPFRSCWATSTQYSWPLLSLAGTDGSHSLTISGRHKIGYQFWVSSAGITLTQNGDYVSLPPSCQKQSWKWCWQPQCFGSTYMPRPLAGWRSSEFLGHRDNRGSASNHIGLNICSRKYSRCGILCSSCRQVIRGGTKKRL